ncbi:MAG: hypothetical protein NTZ09_04885 [Candidatus Hydrogenedentes bacterium]|nr:hypothetical protein [Candidatus Hydrogenedentota bacterium]
MRRSRPAAAFLAVLVAASARAGDSAFILEAEQGTVTSPAAAIAAEGARSGRAVRINEGSSHVRMNTYIDPLQSSTVGDRGEVDVRFNIEEPGPYVVWVRLQWHCPCSPYLNIRTSGRYVGDTADPVSTGLLTSSERPLVWHWANAGTYEFDSGPQNVRLVQRGHLSLIDSVALSPDPGYRPPGYADLSQAFVLAGPDGWKERPTEIKGRIPFCDREWGDFSFEICFPINPKQPQFAFYLCGRGDNAYTISFDGRNSLRGSLSKVEGGKKKTLADWTPPDPAQTWHAVRVERVRGEINVVSDGAAVAEAWDDSLSSGQCGLFASADHMPEFRDLFIRSMRAYDEFFTGGAFNWQPLSGKWRVAAEPAGPSYVGSGGGAPGVTVAPWRTGDCYALSCSVRLLEVGAGGLAFDVTDAATFAAFVLRAEAGLPSRYELISFRDGKPQVLWTGRCALEMDQWAQLKLEKQAEAVFLAADGEPLAAIELPVGSGGGAVGLVAVGGGCAQFIAARCRETRPALRFSYVFEPPGDYTALAYWRPIEGTFTLQGHPGRLAINGDKTRLARLAWRIPAESAIEVHVTVKQPAVRPRPKSLIPDLPLPVLPDDPRIGIAFVPDTAPDKPVKVSTDALRMQGLRIQQGDRVLFEKTSPPATSGDTSEKTLVFRLDSPRVAASAGGSGEKSAEIDPVELRGTLELFADNLAGAPIDVTRILIHKKPAPNIAPLP